ncbi:MAG TPA: hypothetical protein VFD91_15095 [Mariniphaga sp.]|nr:hypothetical protein [Mariniphaga sp.]
MEIGKYIILLLPEHDTVVVPGIGAFVSKYKSAQIDDETGEMIPPSKEIFFEPKIRNNDGLLVGKIAEVEGIPFTEANKEFNYAREEMLYRLDRGESVKLENIGELSYDQKGALEFSSSGKNFLLLDAYGLERGSLKDQPKKKPPKENSSREKPRLVKPPVVHKEKTIQKEEMKKDIPVQPTKRRRSLWLLLLLIPILAGAIYIITKDTQVPDEPINDTSGDIPVQHNIPLVDTTAKDTMAVQEEVVAENSYDIDDSTGFITADTSKYYLIRGSFEEFDNARKYFNRLKSQGYNPFHLGKYGSFYLVGINIYDNPIEAYGQQYNYLDKYPESGVWIFSPGKPNAKIEQ